MINRGIGICVLRKPLKNAGAWRGFFEPSIRCDFSGEEACLSRIQKPIPFSTTNSPY